MAFFHSMVTNSNSKNTFIFVNGIGKPEFKLWHDWLIQILNKETSLIVKSGDLSDDDLSFISESIPEKQIFCFETDLLSQESNSHYLFTDTADSITLPKNLSSSTPKSCLFGGLEKNNFSKQVEKLKNLNFSFFYSDILPEELGNSLNINDVEFVAKNFRLVLPSLKNDTNNSSQNSEKILLIYDSSSTDYACSGNRIFKTTLENLDETRSVDLSKIPLRVWANQLLPSSVCEVILNHSQIPSIHHYLSTICLDNNINYVLGEQSFISPSRNFFTGNKILSAWLEKVPVNSNKSLRQSFKDILNSTSLRNLKPEDIKKQDLKNSSFQISDPFNKSISDITDSSLYSIENFYQNKYRLPKSSDKQSYIYNSLSYLLRNESKNLLIHTGIQFYSFFDDSEIAKTTLNQLMECCLKISTNLVQDQVVYNGYYKLFLISPKTFINSFVKNFLGNRSEKTYLDQAGAILQMVQRRNIEKKDRDLFFHEFLKLPLPNNLQTRALLGNAQLDLFEISIKKMWSESSSDGAGASVFDLLHQIEDFKDETLKYLKKCCEDEISKDLGQLRTHISVGIINILLNEKLDVSKNLSNPEHPRNDFKNFPFIWHEIALFSLSQGRLEETSNLLRSTTVTEKDKAFSKIGEIAILILLEEFNTVVELLRSFPRNLLSDLWNPRFSVYYTAFYLSVIFKFCGKIEAYKKTISIMDQDLIAIDSRFRTLLDNVRAVDDCDSSIHEIMDLLEYSL